MQISLLLSIYIGPGVEGTGRLTLQPRWTLQGTYQWDQVSGDLLSLALREQGHNFLCERVLLALTVALKLPCAGAGLRMSDPTPCQHTT